MRSRPVLRPVAIAAVAVLVIACSPAGPAAQSPAASAAQSAAPNFDASSTLTIRTEGPWADFDPGTPPGKAGNLPSGQISAGLYDRLIDMTPDGKPVPYLATSWEQTPTSLKFVLRKDIICSDGTPLTASAVAKSFDNRLGISDPKTKSSGALGAFGPGPFTVSADDATGTFTLNLGSPYSEALTGVALANEALVICPKGLVPGALDNAAFGTGPYAIASQDRPNSITLKLRSEWKWGPGGRDTKGLPGTIVYKAIANDTTAANLLLTGGLDIARIQGIDVKRLLADNSLGRLVKTPLYTNPMWINMNPGHPTADIKVREALATAVSADGWNTAAFGGLGEVTTSLFAKSAPCYDPATAQLVPQTDIAKAKSILQSAGYTLDSSGKFSKGGQPLRIALIGEGPQGAGPEYLLNQFTQLGITVDYVNTDHVNYSSNYLQPGKWDVIVPGIATDLLGQAMGSYRGADPPTGRNFSRIHDPAMEDLMSKALQQTGAQACATWGQVQAAWLTNYYLRPLSAQNFHWFFTNPKWSFVANTSIIQANSFK